MSVPECSASVFSQETPRCRAAPGADGGPQLPPNQNEVTNSPNLQLSASNFLTRKISPPEPAFKLPTSRETGTPPPRPCLQSASLAVVHKCPETWIYSQWDFWFLNYLNKNRAVGGRALLWSGSAGARTIGAELLWRSRGCFQSPATILLPLNWCYRIRCSR